MRGSLADIVGDALLVVTDSPFKSVVWDEEDAVCGGAL